MAEKWHHAMVGAWPSLCQKLPAMPAARQHTTIKTAKKTSANSATAITTTANPLNLTLLHAPHIALHIL
jgi:hypothetical protein